MVVHARGPCTQWATTWAPDVFCGATSARRGSGTQWAPEAPRGNEWWARQGKEPLTKPGWEEPRTTARSQCSVKHPGHHAGAHATSVNHEAHATCNQQGTRPAHARPTEWASVCGGRPGQSVEEPAPGPHAHGNAARQVVDGLRTEVDSKNSQTTPGTTSITPIRQLLGAANAQTAHPAPSSTTPAHQPLGSTNAETTPAGAPAAAAHRKQRPNATCKGKNG